MAARRAARSSSSEPDSPLTEADIKALKCEFGDGFRDFADDEWREFKALLQDGSKRRYKTPDDPLGVFMVAIMKLKQWGTDLGLPPTSDLRVDAIRMLAVVANYYWKNRAKPSLPRDSLRQLEKLIKSYRRDWVDLSKLALGYLQELFLTAVIINRLETKQRDLQDGLKLHEGATLHRRQLVFNLILIWVACGGHVGHSRNPVSGKLGGPLIRYLTFACMRIMDQEDVPAAGTLRDDIRDFKKGPKT